MFFAHHYCAVSKDSLSSHRCLPGLLNVLVYEYWYVCKRRCLYLVRWLLLFIQARTDQLLHSTCPLSYASVVHLLQLLSHTSSMATYSQVSLSLGETETLRITHWKLQRTDVADRSLTALYCRSHGLPKSTPAQSLSCWYV